MAHLMAHIPVSGAALLLSGRLDEAAAGAAGTGADAELAVYVQKPLEEEPVPGVQGWIVVPA